MRMSFMTAASSRKASLLAYKIHPSLGNFSPTIACSSSQLISLKLLQDILPLRKVPAAQLCMQMPPTHSFPLPCVNYQHFNSLAFIKCTYDIY